MKISLIGFMGSGKTTVAHELANRIHHKVIEMDTVILGKTKLENMQQLFDKGGEALLREWEIRLSADFTDISDTIISTGGGVVLNEIIIDNLKLNNGIVVFLKTSFEEIAKRVSQHERPRPLFKNKDEAKKLYDFRLPLYEKYADIIIETDNKEVHDIVTEILHKTKNEN